MDRMTGKIAFRVTAVCATIACLAFASVAETAPPSLGWTRIADLPGSQHASCAAVIDGKVYLAGGQNPPGPPNYNMMRIYDSQHPELGWVDGPPMPTRRYWPGAGVIEWAGKTELYVVGGYSGYSGLSTVERYIVSENRWEGAASITGSRGHGIMTAVVGNDLYAMGGFVNGPTGYFDTNEVYDRENNTWLPRRSLPRPLQAGTPAVWGGKIFIFGGSGPDGALKTTLIYDPATDNWSQGTDAPRNHQYGRAPTIGNYIYLVAHSSDAPGVIDVYDPANDTWHTTDAFPGASSYPMIADDGQKVYALGGGYGQPGELECWVGEVAPSSWHDPWGYRKQIAITNNVPAVLYRYSIKITLDTAALVAAGKMQADCGDIRIVEGGNEIAYGIRNPNTASTEVYFIADDLDVGDNNDIFMYYGNPQAADGFVANWKDAYYIWWDDFDADRGWGLCPGGTDVGSVTVDTANGWLYAEYNVYRDYFVCPTDGSSFPMDNRVGFKAETRIMAENDYLCQVQVMLRNPQGTKWVPIADLRVGHNDYGVLWSGHIGKTLDDDVWYEATGMYDRLTGAWYGEFANDGLKSGIRPPQEDDDFSIIGLDICNNINIFVDYIYLRYWADPEPDYVLGEEQRTVDYVDGPIAHWTFDDPADPGHDDSGNGHDLTIPGSWSSVDAPDGTLGLALEASSSGPRTPTSSMTYPGPAGFAVAFWAKPEEGHFPAIRDYGGTFGETFRLLSANVIDFQVRHGYNNDHPIIGIPGEQYYGEWVHVAGVYEPDGPRIKLYVNGELREQADMPAPMRTSLPPYLYVCGSLYGTDASVIDDVRVYDRALSAEEIREMGDVFDPAEMCHVPAGTFTTSTGVEVYLDEYSIGKYEVTNSQYCEFLNSGGKDEHYHGEMAAEIQHGDTYQPVAGMENRPVRWISWNDADAYCVWLSASEGLPAGTYHLPTEAQWEKAAGWDPDLQKLWTYALQSDTIDCERANYNACVGHSTDVGSYHPWRSYYGCCDMT
ncbi:MAG: SUMF1/EgtB/PvdO family nonheme iron enzyme, partial [Planctomycetes bacterium]|nr:SUMF1/EgtB/PvdO family nonheme iron enzyme [Planctomycetota bacterium]